MCMNLFIYHFYFMYFASLLLWSFRKAPGKNCPFISNVWTPYTVYVSEAGGGMFVLLRINLNNMQWSITTVAPHDGLCIPAMGTVGNVWIILVSIILNASTAPRVVYCGILYCSQCHWGDILGSNVQQLVRQ